MGELDTRGGLASKRWVRVCVPLCLIAIGILVRMAAFGSAPAGFNQDEAFAGYETWSLLTYGVDSWGYPWPCYFVSWGSGMNVLESYLAIPFLALLGCTETALRLPQLLCACLSLPVLYDLLRRMISRRAALIGLGLLAISPWHILLSRWGLESNLAPAFLLFGFYFLVRGLEDGRFLLASAAAYGLSLYAYAINWVVVPLTLCTCGIYLLACGRRFRMGYLLGAVGILFVLALPLILFVLVNLGVIGEIVTPWLSVPELAAMRDGEVSLANLLSPAAWQELAEVVFLQRDGLIWNGVDGFGLFYPLSLPFQLLGAARLVRGAVKSLRARTYSWQVLVLVWAGCGVVVSLLVANLNITKANSLHLCTLIFITAGLDGMVELCRRARRIGWLPPLTAAAYTCCFLAFAGIYFTSYQEKIGVAFRQGVGEAVAFLREQEFAQVYVDGSVYYSQILFYDQTPHRVYRETVEYGNYPAAFLEVEGFGRYVFGIDYGALEEGCAYLVPVEQGAAFSGDGWQTRQFEGYLVAWRK